MKWKIYWTYPFF